MQQSVHDHRLITGANELWKCLRPWGKKHKCVVERFCISLNINDEHDVQHDDFTIVEQQSLVSCLGEHLFYSGEASNHFGFVNLIKSDLAAIREIKAPNY